MAWDIWGRERRIILCRHILSFSDQLRGDQFIAGRDYFVAGAAGGSHGRHDFRKSFRQLSVKDGQKTAVYAYGRAGGACDSADTFPYGSCFGSRDFCILSFFAILFRVFFPALKFQTMLSARKFPQDMMRGPNRGLYADGFQ